MGVRNEVGRVVRATWREVRKENITFMAASVAYYAFVSMLPLLLFALFVLSAIDNESLTASLHSLTASVLTPYARQLLLESLESTSARTGVSVIGVVALLWGTFKIFRGLDIAFSQIYDVEQKEGLLHQLRNALVVVFALATAVTAVVAAGTAFALFPDLPFPEVLNPLLLVVGLAIAFFPIYYVFPDVDVTPREVLPGVLVAAVGWATLEAAFHWYVTFASRYEAVYGTLGSALLLVTWLYFSGLVLLVGAAVNAVLAGRTGDENTVWLLDELESTDVPDSDGRATLEGRKRFDGRERAEGRGESDDGRDDSVPSPLRRVELDRSSESHPSESRPSESRPREPRSTRPPGRPDEAPDGSGERLRTTADGDAAVGALRERVERLEAENSRLKRENALLARRVRRSRWPIWTRAKRWILEKRR